MELERVKQDIYNCFRCGWCREQILGGAFRICPIREELGFESTYARGRTAIARGILEGEINYSEPLVERVFSCLGCGNCKAHCPTKVDTPEIIKAQKEDIYRKGLRNFSVIDEIDTNLETSKNPLGINPLKRGEWAKGLDLPSRGKFLFFAGCYASYSYPETARAIVRIFKKAGNTPAYLGDEEWCCGIPQSYYGSASESEEMIRHNIQRIVDAGVKKVVTACPDCYNALKNVYPQKVGKLGFEVVHISEALLHLIEEGKIHFEKPVSLRVTYHDPCRLGRHQGIYEPPREVLRLIPGLEIVEMKRNRENAWCCGGGGTVNILLPKMAIRISESRVEEAVETGAQMIVTCCSLCFKQLLLRTERMGLEVKDLSVLVAEAMGLGADLEA